MKIMRTKFRMLPCLLALLALSCTERVDEAQEQPAERTIRVTVGSGPRLDIESRTALSDDGRKVVWSTNDEIALWAFDDQGAATLNGHGFRLWHYNAEYDQAKFTADIPEMAEGTYNYCAFYPVPDAAAIDGTRVSYTVPAVQNGRYDPASDIMTAYCSGGALVEGDNSDRVALEFKHKVHLLEITVPTCALGEAVTSLELEFPVAVAGRLTFDAADAAAEPELTEGSNLLSLRFDEPIEAGAKVYALIAPVEIPADQPVAIRAVGTTGESRTDTFGEGRRFAAGGVTPIEYNIPEMELHYTIIDFTLSNDGRTPNITLGEPVQTFELAVDGGTFDNGLATRSFALADVAASASGERTFRMIFKEFNDNLSGKTVRVTYDSAHAVVTDSFTMPTLEAGATNSAAKLEVPYLFEENFDGLANDYVWNLNGEDGNGGHDDNATYFPEEPGLSEWSGGQVRIEQNRLRIRNRREYAASSFLGDSYGNYRGRVDSAPIKALKTTVGKVVVHFAYGGATENSVFTSLMSCGYTTNNTPLSPYYEVYVANRLNSSGGTKLESVKIDSKNAGQDSSWTSGLTEDEYTIEQCGATTRLSWEVNATGRKTNTYCNQFLYIDNIRVSIVNE